MSYVIYQHEPFGIAGQVEFTPQDQSQSLDDYNIVIMLSTTSAGKVIKSYTDTSKGGVTITRSANNGFRANFSSDETAKLCPGSFNIDAAMIHIASGIRSISQMATNVEVKPTRLKEEDLTNENNPAL